MHVFMLPARKFTRVFKLNNSEQMMKQNLHQTIVGWTCGQQKTEILFSFSFADARTHVYGFGVGGSFQGEGH